jgi:hypothetical protein
MGNPFLMNRNSPDEREVVQNRVAGFAPPYRDPAGSLWGVFVTFYLQRGAAFAATTHRCALLRRGNTHDAICRAVVVGDDGLEPPTLSV